MALAGWAAGCDAGARPVSPPGAGGAAVIRARPAEADEPLPPAGTRGLGLGGEREPLLHVPAGLPPGQRVALVVSLHGAGGDAPGGLGLLQPLAERHGFVVLAPASRNSTWDAVRGGYGPDVALLERALDRAFRSVPVDPTRVAVAGFSDGASYALGLGLANGDLFGRVVAFSPGFVPLGPRTGQPAVFLSHGTDDDVLPLARTSRRIVPQLRDEGLDVTYREFAGGHVVPPEVAEEAVAWLGWQQQ